MACAHADSVVGSGDNDHGVAFGVDRDVHDEHMQPQHSDERAQLSLGSCEYDAFLHTCGVVLHALANWGQQMSSVGHHADAYSGPSTSCC